MSQVGFLAPKKEHFENPNDDQPVELGLLYPILRHTHTHTQLSHIADVCCRSIGNWLFVYEAGLIPDEDKFCLLFPISVEVLEVLGAEMGGKVSRYRCEGLPGGHPPSLPLSFCLEL